MPAHEPHDAHEEEYDCDRTQEVLARHTGGNRLDPLNMIYDDVKECFRLIGKNKTAVSKEKADNSAQEERIKSLETQVCTLQTRLWGLLAGAILAGIGGAVTWFTT